MVLDLRLTKIGCRETINFFCPYPKPVVRCDEKRVCRIVPRVEPKRLMHMDGQRSVLLSCPLHHSPRGIKKPNAETSSAPGLHSYRLNYQCLLYIRGNAPLVRLRSDAPAVGLTLGKIAGIVTRITHGAHFDFQTLQIGEFSPDVA